MDEKATRILTNAYWGPQGWRNGKVSAADFAYARSQGVMFDPLTITHDALVRRTIQVRDQIGIEDLARAFLASLSSRRL